MCKPHIDPWQAYPPERLFLRASYYAIAHRDVGNMGDISSLNAFKLNHEKRYGLNVCVPSKIHIETPNPNVFGGGSFGR